MVSRIQPGLACWSVLVALLAVHLGMNYRAVRAVKMRTINRQRCNILFSALCDTDTVLTPSQVSEAEAIFEMDGALRWRERRRLGHCLHGATLAELLRVMAARKGGESAVKYRHETLARVCKHFEKRRYIIFFDTARRQGVVLLKQGADARDQLQAWAAVLLTAKMSDSSAERPTGDVLGLLCDADARARDLWTQHGAALQGVGWDLDATMLETHAGRRVEGL